MEQERQKVRHRSQRSNEKAKSIGESMLWLLAIIQGRLYLTLSVTASH